MQEKYFSELSRILSRNGIETAPLENNRLPILLNGQPIGRVNASALILVTPDDLQTPKASALYQKAVPLCETVQ